MASLACHSASATKPSATSHNKILPTGIPDPTCRPAKRLDTSGGHGSVLLESVLDLLASLFEVAHALISLALIFHLLVISRLANVFLGCALRLVLLVLQLVVPAHHGLPSRSMK